MTSEISDNNVNNFDMYLQLTDQLISLWINPDSAVRSTVDSFKEIQEKYEVEIGKVKNVSASISTALDVGKITQLILTIKKMEQDLKNLKNKLASNKTTLNQAFGKNKNRLKKVVYVNELKIKTAEDALSQIAHINGNFQGYATEFEKLAKIGNKASMAAHLAKLSKFFGYVGVGTAIYDVVDAGVKYHDGDIWAAFYSMQTGGAGIAGIFCAPIGIAATAADLVQTFGLQPFIYGPGDDFQTLAMVAVEKVGDINISAIKAVGSVIYDHNLKIAMKEERIISIFQQQGKLTGDIRRIVDQSFGDVIIKSWVQGSYQAFNDAVKNGADYSERIKGNLWKFKLINNQYLVLRNRKSNLNIA